MNVKTSNHIGFVAQAALQPLGHAFQKPVAGGMPERVVDGLEAIEVEREDRQRRDGFLAERLVEAFAEHRAVGQVGQRVVMGKMGHALFDKLALGDVVERRYPAATAHRQACDKNRPAIREMAICRMRFRRLKAGFGLGDFAVDVDLGVDAQFQQFLERLAVGRSEREIGRGDLVEPVLRKGRTRPSSKRSLLCCFSNSFRTCHNWPIAGKMPP